ncbi:L-threonylcarbamoyladenylate synthase [Allobranchiibius sp. GilTou38]|uniref:L-threonylcarbamoyladenylate synthase n=1 Tax=Allobranchiibius sp. GilTou38 TaxID=2815210 RepID=UPI001AA113F4|nr:L-threonylcarbamoyladenylate synthase [Allobranchiibius sp. GilTou38]MBO1767591.1 threonylcarbamoyl-AMP synthase [Allobranchiibius sp. GilTou38]
MSPVFDCANPQTREDGLDAAKSALDLGECVVLPTDTVYGIGADAFNPSAVQKLLDAKGRGREMPPPVLVPGLPTVDGLAMSVPSYARRLMERFWPGGLTLILRAQPSLAWDLGDNNGTVGLRMPDDEVALALLERVGPMAVSSANRTGKPTATTITEAGFALGPSVEVYLDGGERSGAEPSTILDCTKPDPVLLRAGAIGTDALREVLAGVELIEPSTGNGVSLSKAPADDQDGPEPLDLSQTEPEGTPDGDVDAGIDPVFVPPQDGTLPASDLPQDGAPSAEVPSPDLPAPPSDHTDGTRSTPTSDA